MFGLKIAAVCFAAALTAGGALAQAPTKIDFQLNWKISGDHVRRRGHREGVVQAGGPRRQRHDIGQGSGFAVQMVDAGKAQIGIADAPVPIEGRTKGAKVKIVGIIFDKHPNAMFFWKDSGIVKIGKGAYEVDTFERSLENCIPENTLSQPRPARGHSWSDSSGDQYCPDRRHAAELSGAYPPAAPLDAWRLAAPSVAVLAPPVGDQPLEDSG